MPRHHTLALTLLTFTGAVAAAQQAAPGSVPLDSAAWRHDLQVLATELPRRHPKPFRWTTRAQFDSAVGDLDHRIPGLGRDEIIVGLMQVVALARDGHTSINPMFDPTLGFHALPIEFAWFQDGLFVIRAAPEYKALAGARVLRIGRMEPEAVLERLATVISHENEWWVKAQAPAYLAIPEVLHGLGIIPEGTRVPLEVEQSGRRQLAVVRATLVPRGGHGNNAGINPANWTDMRGDGAPPLYLQEPERVQWFRYLPESRTLYVAHRAVIAAPPEPLPLFYIRLFAAIDSIRPDHLVLDLRANGGGNNFFNLPLVQGIVRRPWLDQRGRFFTIISGHTFSAAMNLVNELERYTNVTFVGEPTGNAPNLYGDARPLILPNSGIRVNVSSIYWQTMNPGDPRRFVPPAIAVTVTSADYRNNVDPVLEAILRRLGEPALEERMAALTLAGDSAGAERLFRDAAAHPENRWRNFEAELNAQGYRLLRGGQVPAAVLIFAINTRVYPTSANVWDSYGEALETSGRREEAIASYRKALALEPQYDSSRQGLRRLGAEP